MNAVRAVPRRDLVIAALVTAAMELEAWLHDLTPWGAAAAAFGVMGVLLAFRSVAPLLVVILGFTALLLAASAGVELSDPVSPILFYVLSLYSLGLHEPIARATAGLVAALGLTGSTLAVSEAKGQDVSYGDVPFAMLICLAPWFVGRAVRVRALDAQQLEERAERLEHERLVAITEERARIARELHDIVAHAVSVMTLQAGAAEEVIKRDPQQAVEPIHSIQLTGRQALAELSRLVGLLRADDDEPALAPQPGLGELDELLERVRGAGLPVELRLEGEPRALPPGVDLSAYRILQEALTNALRYSGPSRTEVCVRYEPGALALDVVDDGTTAPMPSIGGHGLEGMRERVSVFGGEFEAGPRGEGGFGVHARLPLEPVPA